MKFNSKLIFVQGAGLLIASAEARVCRALAMSGGGSNGAWEAGVLFGFAMTGNPEDFYYDVISGISAGSVNTAGLAGFAP
jgi:predicted acylesterase/phospholipase RssA